MSEDTYCIRNRRPGEGSFNLFPCHAGEPQRIILWKYSLDAYRTSTVSNPVGRLYGMAFRAPRWKRLTLRLAYCTLQTAQLGFGKCSFRWVARADLQKFSEYASIKDT
jgi:hypothetical protein